MKEALLRMVWGMIVIGVAAAPWLAPGADWTDASQPPPPPAGSPGYPSRAADLDALPGFRNPPPGYGEVPFWWWTGDPLDKDRLLWQIEQLHQKGISGVQVNYAHEDTPGWPTYPAQPEIFSDAWWDMWTWVADACRERGMGIGLSGYTIDWPNGTSLISRTIYSDPEITGRELQVAQRARVQAGDGLVLDIPGDTLGVRAYRIIDGIIQPGGRDLHPAAAGNRMEWSPTEGEWEVWVFASVPRPGSINPMHPEAGHRVVQQFFQRFQDHSPGPSAPGLNYFFQDELKFGVEDPLWTADLAEQFRVRKGYDLFDILPALFADMGAVTPKARLDYMDVRMQLVQERYFVPIFQWHWSRGMIYGCDQGSRGRDPIEFGDYFSAVRWYTAPGHDTPGGKADLIKGKVSSSIAHLYKRPRVWLEGYHSLGWSAAPERLMQATCENYLYGCTLLNLHGLYYTTHGSFWEWAPPSYHFRMPYWDHMGLFLKYFERMSYLLSQGVHQCDVAVLYPVSPGQAGMGGKEATDMAFAAGTHLFAEGRDFIFMDDESLARAEIKGGRLHVADASYRVLVLPAMRALRWATLQKAHAFFRAGGMVIAMGGLPEASDRAGRDDPELDGVVKDLFGATAREVEAGHRPETHRNESGGVSAVLSADPLHPGEAPEGIWASLSEILRVVPLDVSSDHPVKALHRKVGPRDVYLVMGAPRGAMCTFRATGNVELWDPWSGKAEPIDQAFAVEGGTRVRMPLSETEAQLIVFTPGTPNTVTTTEMPGAPPTSESTPMTIPIDGPWEFELVPTMDNRWGDFRLPATQTRIGPEARIFQYAEETAPNPGWEAPAFDAGDWPRVTCGFGQKFWKLGPLPADLDASTLDARLAALGQVDPTAPVEIAGTTYRWSPYAFSWRWGTEGDPGHQGYHGLKEMVTDDFICLGKPRGGLNETLYESEVAGTRYYLWTAAVVPERTAVIARCGGLTPAAAYLGGKPFTPGQSSQLLESGATPLLLRYDTPGRGHFVLRASAAESLRERTPLAMTWYDDPGIVPYDVRPAEPKPAGWYRFTAPPGLSGMTIPARGTVRCWVDGQECVVSQGEAAACRVDLDAPVPYMAAVALRIEQERGRYGGSALPEPVQMDCGIGSIGLGDWSQGSVLECYSGGAWYRRNLTLTKAQAGGRILLNLGDVVATAEVRVNGKTAGIRVAPPWTVDLSRHLQAGSNRLEILVYNTLANHYLTVPTRYRGSLRSGLIGPVRLDIQPALEEEP